MEEKKDFLDELTQNCMAAAIIIASALTLLGMIFQFVSPEAQALVTQLSYYAYGWTVFLALGPTVKRGMFMRIDLVANRYPKALQTWLKAAADLVLFLLMLLLCVLGIQSLLTAVAEGAVNASAPLIPLALAYAAPVVGYALGMIAYITKLFRAEKGGKSKLPQCF